MIQGIVLTLFVLLFLKVAFWVFSFNTLAGIILAVMLLPVLAVFFFVALLGGISDGIGAGL